MEKKTWTEDLVYGEKCKWKKSLETVELRVSMEKNGSLQLRDWLRPDLRWGDRGVDNRDFKKCCWVITYMLLYSSRHKKTILLSNCFLVTRLYIFKCNFKVRLGPVGLGSYTNLWSSEDNSVWMAHKMGNMGMDKSSQSGRGKECIEWSPEKFQ